MMTQSEMNRIRQMTNGHWSLSPNNKDAVTEKILEDLSQTVRKKLRGMRPNAGLTIELFIGECRQ